MALFSFTPHNLIAIHNLAEGIFLHGLGAVVGGSIGAIAVVLDPDKR